MPANNLLRHVNPLQGTNSYPGFSRGNCLPLVSLPFGMTSWSPQTDEGNWMFQPGARKLQGVRATHQPSPWIGDYGHFTVMAQVGRPLLSAHARSSTFRPDETMIKPHYFSANLRRYRTRMEVTPTERCSVFRFTFPATDQARVILEPFAGASQVECYPERNMVCGFTRANSGGVPENFACYFAAAFDRSFVRFAPFQKGTAFAGEMRREGERVGGFVEFQTAAGQVIEMKIATSFISVEQAERNLQQEIGDADFAEVCARAERIWNDALSRILIEGATEAEQQTFYTCLYRAQLFPRLWYEYGDDGNPVHFSPYDGAVHAGVLYADNGFWDTYRTVYPLFSLLLPDRLAEILQGWVQACQEGGWFPQWASPGYRACMIGTHIDSVIADAYVKGVRGFDVEAAYAGLIKHARQPGDAAGNYGRLGIEDYLALGYVAADRMSAATSRTLDYAYNDFCIAQIARGLGRDSDYRLLRERTRNYRHVYDPTVGFMRGRNGDGSWQTPFEEFSWGGPFVEGGPWQSSWGAPHDPAGLIALMGGPEALVARLDQMLQMPPRFDVGTYGFEIHEMTEMACADFGQYAHSNQPVHHVLYLFTCAGQPWKTQYWARKVLAELYGPESLPGDEDNGEMSSWYIFNALGLYPLCPGHPSYVFGSPLFRRAQVNLPGGKTLVIEAPGNTKENVYVQSVRVNGRPYGKLWIGHETLVQGGTLEFMMGDAPVTGTVFSAEDLPYSLSQDPGF